MWASSGHCTFSPSHPPPPPHIHTSMHTSMHEKQLGWEGLERINISYYWSDFIKVDNHRAIDKHVYLSCKMNLKDSFLASVF